MVYSFARIGAVLSMNVEDYWWDGRRFRFRLYEHDYIEAAGIRPDKNGPLFRTINSRRQLTANRLKPTEALLMIKRRARAAGLPDRISNHTFRASGITAYLQGGGTLGPADRGPRVESSASSWAVA